MAVWNPGTLNPLFWIDPSDSATITLDAGTVAQIDDLSGNGRHAVGGGGNSNPAVSTSGMNGLDVMHFYGSQFVDAPFPDNMTDRTVFTVTKKDPTSHSYDNTAIYLTIQAGGNRQSQLNVNDSSGYNARLNFEDGDNAATGYVDLNPHVFMAGLEAGVKSYSRLDGGAHAAFDSIDTGLTPTANQYLRIGRNTWSLGGVSWVGDIAEVVVFDRDLTADERDKVEGYLAHKWGTEGELPATHPYKGNPPTDNYVTGVIMDASGNPCQRQVYIINRPIDGSRPDVIAYGLSDPSTGEYSLPAPVSGEVSRVVVSEDDSNPLLNDIIDRIQL